MNKDFDDEDDDLEEVDPDENAGSDSYDSASASDEFDYDDDDLEEIEEDDASFFDESSEEDDDLCLGESAARVPSLQTVAPPPARVVDIPVQAAEKPASRPINPVFFILPFIAILVGIGIFFFRTQKGGESLPPVTAKSEKAAILPPAIPDKVSMNKGQAAGTVTEDCMELKRVEVTDPLKIISLADPSLLEKKLGDSGLSIDKLTFSLCKTKGKFVVLQIYRYSDGTEVTAEAPFRENTRNQEEVVKDFGNAYHG
jgi:hypothetical protein